MRRKLSAHLELSIRATLSVCQPSERPGSSPLRSLPRTTTDWPAHPDSVEQEGKLTSFGGEIQVLENYSSGDE
jgi:hypothetical protein